MKKPDWWEVARLALLSRAIDQLEVDSLTPQGKVKYQFSAAGHELGQILLAKLLDHKHDAATVYYRSRPMLLASGMTAVEALASGMARAGSQSDGRDVGVMFNRPGRQGTTILPTSGNVGAQYTPAVGWAQAIKYRHHILGDPEWAGAVAAACGGESSTAASGFWAAINIATTQSLPILFFIENNRYGLSVRAELQTPGGSIARNLASFSNLTILSGDGTDPIQAWELIHQAVSHVRLEQSPCLLELSVVRLTGHTFIDDQAYKSETERSAEEARDPQKRLREFLNDENKWQSLEMEIQHELKEALKTAEELPAPDPSKILDNLFFEGNPQIQGGLRTENALIPMGSDVPASTGPRINFIDAVRRTLQNELELNPRMLVFGEDVGVKGGVHGATLDLQLRFGSDRIFDTSLNEDGIIGRANGMALAGLLPVPEIQFRKYADPAHEQISDLGTIRWRTNNNFAAPMVVRIPVGFGKQTGDPWHSVSGEAVFAHLPGWQIAYPSNAEDAVGLLRTALRGDDPVFFLEHRALLDTRDGRRKYPGDDYCLPFGRAAYLAKGDELTLVTWGAMVPRCLEAASHFADRIDLIDLRTLLPWDRDLVLESVRQTGKLLIVQEDTITVSFSGEITAWIANHAFTYLDAPIVRLGVPDIPIPYHSGLMESIVPAPEQIVEKIQDLLEY